MGGNGAPSLCLNKVETTLKDLVKIRVLGHLQTGPRESVLARDVTKFCNQISAQVKGVSESKDMQARGYQMGPLSNEIIIRISLVILKELIENGCVINRHI